MHNIIQLYISIIIPLVIPFQKNNFRQDTPIKEETFREKQINKIKHTVSESEKSKLPDKKYIYFKDIHTSKAIFNVGTNPMLHSKIRKLGT